MTQTPEQQGFTRQEFFNALVSELVHYPQARVTDIFPIAEMICPGFDFDDTIEVYADERDIGNAAQAYYSTKTHTP